MIRNRHELVARLYTRLESRDDRGRAEAIRRLRDRAPELSREIESLLSARVPRHWMDGNALETSGWHDGAGENPRASYRLLGRLGEGGTGEVLLARQTAPVQRPVAIKVLKRSAVTPETESRFRNECRVLALMNHPHIATIHDVGTAVDGRPFIVMEHVQGVPITRYCDRHRLSVDARIELLLQACDAIQHAHRRGVIHRDVKPSNVLVGVVDGRAWVKVIDFGVAKAIDPALASGTIRSETGQLIGTLGYMAPEQLGGSETDLRSDVYALGALLYELLVGETPHGLERPDALTTLVDLLWRMRAAEAPRPSARTRADGFAALRRAGRRQARPAALRRRLRGPLDRVVLKAVARLPDRRYETAAGLAADLRRDLAGEPVHAGEPSRCDRFVSFVRRHPTVSAVLVSTFVALMVGLVVSMNFAIKAMHAADAARQATDQSAWRAYANSMVAADAALAARNYPLAIRMLREADPDRTGWERDYLSAVANQSVASLAGHEQGVFAVDFADDGSFVATGSEDGTVRIWEPGTWTCRKVIDVDGDVRGVDVHPNGSRVLVSMDDGSVHVQALEEAVWSGVLRVGGDRSVRACYSPDGRYIAIARHMWNPSHADRSEIEVLRADDHSLLWRREGGANDTPTMCFSPDGQMIACGSSSGLVRAWAVETGTLITSFQAGDWLSVLAFHPKEPSVVLVVGAEAVLYDLRHGTRRWVQPEAAPVMDAAFSPDGTTIALASMDATLRLRRVDDGTLSTTLSGHDGVVRGVAFAPGGDRIVTTGGLHVLVWNPVPAPTELRFDTGVGPLISIAFAPDSTLLAAAGRGHGGAIRLWELPSGRPVGRLEGHTNVVGSLQFIGGGRELLSSSHDGTVRIWDVRARECIRVIEDTAGSLLYARMSPDGTRIATCGHDGRVLVRHGSGVPHVLIEHGSTVMGLEFSPAGDLLAAAADGGRVYIWDVSTWRLRHVLKHGDEADAVTFTPDGATLVSTGSDRRARFWDPRTGACRDTVADVGSSVTFTPDGRRFAETGRASELTLWDVEHLEPVLSLDALYLYYYGPRFSPDGRYLAATRARGGLNLWMLPDRGATMGGREEVVVRLNLR